MQRIALIIFIALLSGCAFNIPSYQVNSENLTLIVGGNKQVKVIQDKPLFEDDGSIFCRGAGNVTLPEGQTFTGYITSALKDELSAGKHLSENSGSVLHVQVKRVDFSSALGATNWYIDADYVLDGKLLSISTVYNDRSSYFGDKACNNMAKYFQKAVSAHLRQLYSKPEFREAIVSTGNAMNTPPDSSSYDNTVPIESVMWSESANYYAKSKCRTLKGNLTFLGITKGEERYKATCSSGELMIIGCSERGCKSM